MVAVDLPTAAVAVLRPPRPLGLDPGFLPPAEAVDFPTTGGRLAQYDVPAEVLWNPAIRGSPVGAGVCAAPRAAKATAPTSGSPMTTERTIGRMCMTVAPLSAGIVT